MSDPTPDAVAKARDAYEDAYYEWRSERKNVTASVAVELAIKADKAWSVLIAAVRAECAATTRPSVKRLNFLANLAFEHPHVRLRLNGGEWTLDTGNATIGRGRTCNDAIDSAMEAQP